MRPERAESLELTERPTLLGALRKPILRFMALGGLLFISKAAYAAKDMMVADRFGTSDALDAYIAGTIVPLFLLHSVSTALGDAFLPFYVGTGEKHSKQERQRLLSALLALSTAGLALICLLLIPAAGPVMRLLSSSFQDSKLHVAVTMMRVLLPVVLLGAWSSIFGAVLVAAEQSRAVAGVQVVTPLFTIGLLLAFRQPDARTLAAGMVVGNALETGYLVWRVRQAGVLVGPRWHGMTAALRHLLSQFGSLLAAQLLAVGSVLVDSAMAAALGAGAVSTLNYGSKVVLAALSVCMVALTMVVLPKFSTLAAQREWKQFWSLYVQSSVGVFLLATVGSVLLSVLSEPMIRLLFQRGSFTPADTLAASQVQRYLALQIPFYLVVVLGVRALSALSRNQWLTITGTLNVAVNIVGNLVLIHFMGLPGIALSTSLVMVVACMVLSFLVWKALRREEPGI